MNNNGNVLINTFASLLLISILIFSVTKGVSQSAELSEHTFERDLLESLMDEVVEDFVPIINDRFYASSGVDPVFYLNFHGNEAHTDFAPELMVEMTKIDNSQFLGCEAFQLPHTGNSYYPYEVVCTPAGTNVEYVISFVVTLDNIQTGDFYYIVDYEYYTRALPE